MLAIWYAVATGVSAISSSAALTRSWVSSAATGPADMLIVGGAFLVLGMFVGRPYCRYLCPYGRCWRPVSRLAGGA